MKVVFVHPSHPSQFTRIGQALAERQGWECAFLVSDQFAGQVRRDDPPVPYFGFREDDVPMSGSYYTRSIEEGARRGKAVAEALTMIKASEGVDAVVGHAAFGATFYASRVLGIPVVSYVELPGYFPAFARDDFPARVPQLLLDVSLQSLIHGSVISSDLCMVPSEYARRLFPPELRHKVRVQMEGFEIPPAVADRRALRRSLGLDGAGPIVGFAARSLEAVRGFDTFARAASAIRAARADARFLVIGDEQTLYGNEGSYLNGTTFKQHALATAGVAEENFTFLPFMPHDRFVRYLQAMDVALFPIFEGAANWGLFEAMAAGVPIVAADRCFVPEVIEDNREGLLRDPTDAAAFATATLQLLDRPDRARTLGKRARARIDACHTVDQAVAGYASLIREAVRRHRRSAVARA